MNELFNFEGNDVIIEKDENGNLLFELYSTGMALGQVKIAKGKKYPRKDRIDKTVENADISTVVRNGQRFLTKEDLYEFTFEAKTDKCRKFRKWLAKVVLPSLEKDGMYVVGEENAESAEEYIKLRAEAEAKKLLRKWGIDVRNNFISAIDEYLKDEILYINDREQFYAMATNLLIQIPVLGHKAFENRKILELSKDANVYEYFSKNFPEIYAEIVKREEMAISLMRVTGNFYKVANMMEEYDKRNNVVPIDIKKYKVK